jgi:hypothetical protein
MKEKSKSDSKEGTKRTLKSHGTIYDSPYLDTILSYMDNGKVRCLRCHKKGEYIDRDSVKRHIISSEHETKAVPGDQLELKSLINKWKIQSVVSSEEMTKNTAPLFLKIVLGLEKLKLSFQQIEEVGNLFKSLQKSQDLAHLQDCIFDRESVSLAVRAIGSLLEKDLEQIIENNHFSFVVDEVTINNQSLLALKIRYVEELFTPKNEFRIQEKLVSLREQGGNPNADSIFEIVKQDLLNTQKKIQNLTGLCSDNAAVLTGQISGLSTQLKKFISSNDARAIADFSDPCHGLHLTLEKMSNGVDTRIISFIKNTTFLFSHSPKKSKNLKNLQIQYKLPSLSPKTWIKTRWLSLGDSLKRLLTIWDSLKLYFLIIVLGQIDQKYVIELEEKLQERYIKEEIDSNIAKAIEKAKNCTKKDLKHLDNLELLYDSAILWRLRYLSMIIGIVNATNILFQTRNLEVNILSTSIIELWNTLADFILVEEYNRDAPSVRIKKFSIKLPRKDGKLKLNLIDQAMKTEFFNNSCLENDRLLMRIKSSEYYTEALPSIGPNELEKSLSFAKDVIYSLLSGLLKYLPYDNPIVSSLTFVTFSESTNVEMDKIIQLNQIFNIIPEDKFPLLRAEVKCFCEISKKFFSNSMELWNHMENGTSRKVTCSTSSIIEHFSNIEDIEGTILSQKYTDSPHPEVSNRRYPLLFRVLSFSQSLSISSSGLEQTFSQLALLKTPLRNQLRIETLKYLLYIDQENKILDPLPQEFVRAYIDIRNNLSARKSQHRLSKEDKSDSGEEDILISKDLHIPVCKSVHINESGKIC